MRCRSCKKTFSNTAELYKHNRHPCKSTVCLECDAVFADRKSLRRHIKRKEDIECDHCLRTFCNQDHFQRHLRTIQRSKRRAGLKQKIFPGSGFEFYRGFEKLLKEKANEIDDYDDISRHQSIYNRRIDSNYRYKDLRNELLDIYDEHDNAFKVNLAFGFILYNAVTNEFKYYYTSSNNLLFEHASTIDSIESLDDFMNKICALDLATNYYLKKPSSGWTLAALTNVEIRTFELRNTLIGAPVDLPDFIKNSKSIISLIKNNRGKVYVDNKCFFRCLALSRGQRRSNLENLTNHLLQQFENHTERSFKSGVKLNNIPALEVFFKVSINIYNLKEDGSCDIEYLSRLDYPPIYLNLYGKHFSYIKNFSTYAKRYKCLMCERIFDQACNLKTHTKTCSNEVKEVYVGGKFKPKETIFDWLAKEGYDVPEEDRYYKFISVYDYEAIQVKNEETLKGRSIRYTHQPISFSVCSNIPGHTQPVHKVSSKPQKLVDKMVRIQLEHQKTAESIMQSKFAWIIESLQAKLDMFEERYPETSKKLFFDSDKKEVREYKNNKSLLRAVQKYCRQLPILGFNSQKYDIPLIRRYLPSSLERLDTLPDFVIKKTNTYMAITTPRLKYLDLINYLAAGTSLEAFYKAYDVSTTKGTFCYEWFNSYEKLRYRGLPPQTQFRSTLTNKGIDAETYMDCWKIWEKEKMKQFKDYVRYYNNHDVVGMIEGIDKMLAIENEEGLDVFKESVSLASLAQLYLQRKLDENDYFCGISAKHSHIYKDLKSLGIVGGPSIIFHRYQEAGKTLIKGKHLCKKVTGYDANALYLCCTGEDMCTGHYVLREKKTDYKRETGYSREAINWLEFLISTGLDIRHAENTPHGEKRIDDYSVDGFCEENNTVYEYYGCYFHGHDCKHNYDRQKWQKTLSREQSIRSLGYNLVSITSCVWRKRSESKLEYPVFSPKATLSDMQDGIMSGEIFGFLKCSVHVPDFLISKFSEFPPIFKNTEIPISAIGEHMQEFCRQTTRSNGVKRSLISSMKGAGIVIMTPLFKKYIEMGLICTDIEWVLEYTPKRVFSWFVDSVTNTRRMADLYPSWKIRGQTAKTKGNATVGITMMDKSKHTSVKFCTEERLDGYIRSPFFKNMDELDGGIFEIEKTKKTVKYDSAIQIGIAVYSYAKLKLLCFWEFLNKFLKNDMYQLMECDTDSLYIAFAADIDDCVKEGLEEEWSRRKYDFFSSDSQEPVEFGGQTITRQQYDSRTPGKFKQEFEGEGMICLNSKVYHIWSGKKSKTSAKGMMERRNDIEKKQFLEMIKNPLAKHLVTNAGFIRTGTDIKTYEQTKTGLSYFYAKRKVLADGVSTTHLDI